LIENLKIREDILLNYDLPFKIREGKIGKLEFQVPSMLMLMSKPAKLHLENIEMELWSITEAENEEKKKRKEEKKEKVEEGGKKEGDAYKKKKIEIWEEEMKLYFDRKRRKVEEESEKDCHRRQQYKA